MSGVVVSVAAALVSLVLVLLFLRFPRAAAGESDERVAAVALDMRARMEAMRTQLGSALADAQREAGRNRVFGELAGATSVEAVARRALEVARSLTGADASVLEAGAPGARRVVAKVGLSDDEARLVAGVRVPEGDEPRGAAYTFGYAERVEGALRSALVVALPAEGPLRGHVAVFLRGEGPAFGPEAVSELETLASGVAAALENARLVEEARTLADTDPVTGLPHRRRFAEALAEAVADSDVLGAPLTLALWDLDDFGAINRRLGHDAGDDALRIATEHARRLLPPEATLARIGPDEFAAVVPGATLRDADSLLRRLRRSLAAAPAPRVGRLAFSAAFAQLDPAEDAATFFERAEDVLARARAGGGLILAAESWALEV